MKKLRCAFLLSTSLLLAVLTSEQAWAQEALIYQKAKISFNQSQDLERLAALDIPVDHGIHKKDYYFISEFSTVELDQIRASGFQVEILIADMKADFLAQNSISMQAAPQRNASACVNTANVLTYPTPVNFNQGTMGGYLTYQEILDELDDMRSLYPNLISAPTNISDFLTEGQPDTSVTPSIGGNGIKWVRISDNPDTDEPEAEILYTSIHHAREPMSLMQNIYYMWYLLENYDTDPEIKNIVDNTELYFVPIVNPDGYLYNEVTDPAGGGFWRKNRKDGHGIDNNRNYNYHINGDASNSSWGGPGSSGNTGSQIYRGPSAFSEIETQAMKWFVEQHEFVMAFNNHTSGQLLYYPFGYADLPTADDALYQLVGAELTSQNGYFALRDSPFSGDSDDFMYGTVGTHDKIFAFTPEIGTSFWPPASAIDPTCKEMMFHNLTAAKMTNNYGKLTTSNPLYVGTTGSVTVDFDLRNMGIAGDGDFTVTLNPISSNIDNAGTPESFNNMETLEEDNGSITYTIASGTEQGEEIIFDLVVDNGMYNLTTTVTQIYGDTEQVFLADGSSTTTGFQSNDWETTTSVFVSSPSSITDSASGNYANNEDTTIAISTVIDLSTALGAGVSYYALWDIEEGFDYVQFEISTDSGTTWIPQCGTFTTRGSAQQVDGEPVYDGVQSQWVKEEINLSDYLGQAILARFQLVSDNGNNRDGFYFDDLEFNVVLDPSLGVNDAFAKAFSYYPNPVSDVLNISSSMINYETVVYNIQGQQISALTAQSGDSRLDYSAYASGIYFVQITAAGKTTTIKVIKQ
ncbi:MAG: hypothetical protein ACJARZ_002689 [Dokdonia sp.]|jgi:hypothetical protein